MNSGFRDERKRRFLNADGADKPLKSPLPHETLVKARAYRLSRIRRMLAGTDCAAILLYDPVNIRYAFDCSNMQVWTANNPLRYALIFADGPGIMFEFKSCEHLCRDLETIDEVRTATGWMFFTAGDRASERVSSWADEISDLMRVHGGGNRRLAVDRMEPEGVHNLQQHGLAIIEGGQITERARSIKSEHELELMRWTIRVCEAGTLASCLRYTLLFVGSPRWNERYGLYAKRGLVLPSIALAFWWVAERAILLGLSL